MNLSHDIEILNKAESLLAELYPSPEIELNNICKLAGYTPQNEEKFAKIRRSTLEIEDLISQTRWHIAQSIIAVLINPDIKDITAKNTETYNHEDYMSTGVSLLLRPYVRDINKVIFQSPETIRKNRPISGWVFNMMIDNVIYRSIAILDRIAHVIAIIGDVQFTNNRVYFRSKKIQTIHDKLKLEETAHLLDLAKSELLEFLTSYRDGFSHEQRQYSLLTGSIPSDIITDKLNQKKTLFSNFPWVAADLMALTNASYDYILKTLRLTNLIYIKYLSQYHDRPNC